MKPRKRQRKKNCEDLPWPRAAGGHRRNHRRNTPLLPWEERLYDRRIRAYLDFYFPEPTRTTG